jgi:Smg protein
MKANVIEVLMFLFDNYLSVSEDTLLDEKSLTCELEEAGFDAKEISLAFDWLGELAEIERLAATLVQVPGNAVRVYAQEEQAKLDMACRGYLQSLETMGLVDATVREIIIDRAMAIEADNLSLQQFKRIIGLVILNKAPQDEMLPWIEELMNDEKADSVIH